MISKQIMVRFIMRHGTTFGVMMNSDSARRLVEDWALYKMRGILRGTGGPNNHYAVNLDEVIIIDTADPEDQQGQYGNRGDFVWGSGIKGQT